MVCYIGRTQHNIAKWTSPGFLATQLGNHEGPAHAAADSRQPLAFLKGIVRSVFKQLSGNPPSRSADWPSGWVLFARAWTYSGAGTVFRILVRNPADGWIDVQVAIIKMIFEVDEFPL